MCIGLLLSGTCCRHLFLAGALKVATGFCCGRCEQPRWLDMGCGLLPTRGRGTSALFDCMKNDCYVLLCSIGILDSLSGMDNTVEGLETHTWAVEKIIIE